jgi:type IV secretory pathway TraG/TraD family ATPase VirD4
MLTIDPAGDIYAATAQKCRYNGYKVIKLDFTNPKDSDGFNILDFMRGSTPFAREQLIRGLCRGLIDDETRGRDPHWAETGQNLAFATIFSEMEVRENVTIFDVAAILTNEALREGKFNEYRAVNNPLVQAAIGSYHGAGEKEQGSFITTTTRKMMIWLSKSAIQICSGEKSFSFRKLWDGDTPSHVYIITGKQATKEDIGIIARTILTIAVMERQRMWDETHRYKREWLTFTDETYMLGNATAIPYIIKQLRKVGARTFLCFPSIAGIRKIYSDDGADDIIGGSSRIVFGGGNDIKDYQLFSQAVGERTLYNPGHSVSDKGESYSENAQAIPLIKGFQIAQLERNEFVGIVNGTNVRGIKTFEIVNDKVRRL